MALPAPLKKVGTNITAKVCFFVFITAAALLSALGAWYLANYNREIAHGLAEKMALPGTLMSQMAMNFDAVTDLPALERIVQERVVEAFVARKEGPIFYASDPDRVGKAYSGFVPAGAMRPASGAGSPEGRLLRTVEGGRRRLALLTPLEINGELIGQLYLKVDAESVARKEREMAVRFVSAAAFSVALIVLITGFWVQRLLVPRIGRTVAVLQEVKAGRLTARVADHGAPDQIGVLMQNVDAMIEQVDARTRNLQALARAAEELANVEDRAGVARTLDGFAGAGDAGQGHDIFQQTLRRLEIDALRRVDALADLRRAEKEYRDLFSNAVEGIFRQSMDGRILAANPGLAGMLGYATPTELLEHFREFLEGTREFEADWFVFVDRVRAAGAVRDFELRIRRRDGEVIWASLSGRALRDAAGEMTAIEGSAVDVSDRRKREVEEAQRLAAEAADRAKSEVLIALEEKHRQLERTLAELRHAQEKLVQTEKMAAMGTMAAGVAHDLNNILSGIVSYPDLLLMQLPEESQWRESLTVIRESGMRAAAVVADLLTMARGAAYAMAPCDLNRLVERHLESPEHRQLLARFPGIRVVTRLAPDLRPTPCSQVHLQKALTNLVMNACEAIHDAGRVVVSTANRAVGATEELARVVAPGDYVALTVSDTGPGIAEKDLARVFEPFFTKKILGRSGTGLGLAVVWNTAQEHQGAVMAESGDDGAVFTMLLPACLPEGEACEEDRLLAPARERLRGSESVLVVDDEPLLRQIAVRILTALGYRVDAVSSGEAAIERLRRQPADLVLLDMLMPPGMNGSETYREIARIRPGQKAVICSGYALSEDFLETRKVGAGGFLKKPYTLEELGLAVRAELDT